MDTGYRFIGCYENLQTFLIRQNPHIGDIVGIYKEDKTRLDFYIYSGEDFLRIEKIPDEELLEIRKVGLRELEYDI